jgi:hypothetical protein
MAASSVPCLNANLQPNRRIKARSGVTVGGPVLSRGNDQITGGILELGVGRLTGLSYFDLKKSSG